MATSYTNRTTPSATTYSPRIDIALMSTWDQLNLVDWDDMGDIVWDSLAGGTTYTIRTEP